MTEPKYKIGQTVWFELEGKLLHGEIVVVDRYGTFEWSGGVSYDVKVGDTWYKHIHENWIMAYTEMMDKQ